MTRLRAERTALIEQDGFSVTRLRALNADITKLEEKAARRAKKIKVWDSRSPESREHYRTGGKDGCWGQSGIDGIVALAKEVGKFVRFDMSGTEVEVALPELMKQGPDAVLAKIQRSDTGVKHALAKILNEIILRTAELVGENVDEVELLEVPALDAPPKKKYAKKKKAVTK